MTDIKTVLRDEIITAIARSFGEGRTQQWMRDYARAIEAAVLIAVKPMAETATSGDRHAIFCRQFPPNAVNVPACPSDCQCLGYSPPIDVMVMNFKNNKESEC